MSPAMELTRMNNAETAAACRMWAHRKNKRRGVRKIPPPVPVRPERNPTAAPVPRATGALGGVTIGGSPRRKIKRTAEKRRTTPIKSFRIEAGTCKYPPRYAAGIESNANGQNKLQEKWRARQNWKAPIEATRILRTRA